MPLRIDLMPKAHMKRAITRMAYQILEDHKGTAPIRDPYPWVQPCQNVGRRTVSHQPETRHRSPHRR